VRPARTRSTAKAIPTQAAAAPAGTEAAAPVPSSAPKPRRKAGKARAFSGATSDHLRPEAVVAAAEASARTAKKKKEKERAFTDVDLMRGKTVELDVQVPKRLRKAARDEAKRRGLDLDAVTTELLHRWLTGR
jgi:hypothetical protein